MNCTEECKASFAKQAAEIAVWQAAWPDHCKTCGGDGGATSHYDPSPSGVSLGSGFMTDYEPCPECSEKGVCPRCGKPAWELEEGEIGGCPCPHCGWNHGVNPGDTCPPEAECFCWIAEGPDEAY